MGEKSEVSCYKILQQITLIAFTFKCSRSPRWTLQSIRSWGRWLLSSFRQLYQLWYPHQLWEPDCILVGGCGRNLWLAFWYYPLWHRSGRWTTENRSGNYTAYIFRAEATFVVYQQASKPTRPQS